MGKKKKGFTKQERASEWMRRRSGPAITIFKAKKGPPYEATKEFLESYEWRRVRMVALKKFGARCQCCGASPADGIRIVVDHIKPRRKFPHLALVVENLQVLCDPCNHGKGNWDDTDWRKK